jgi:pilus assembly protein FimV
MAKPAGVSVHQTMLDIQRLNPDAFINGNINRIEAGYIIYLPSADDISSADLPTALAEVREQNAAWREGRDEASYASSGPSLRISAEPEESADVETTTQRPAVSEAPAAEEAQQSGGSSAAAGADDLTTVTLERLAALEQQLATLQRIVALKDDQIAALQNAVADAGGTAADVEPGVVAPDITPVTTEPVVGVDEEQVEEESAEGPVAVDPAAADPVAVAPAAVDEQVAASTPAKKPQPAEASESPAPTPPVTATGESWTSYLLYMLGAVVLVVAGFVFVRRRVADADEEESLTERPVATKEDVFADVRLQDQNVEVEPVVEEPVVVEEDAPSTPDNRGYGEHKHDEYASDVDAADALAEADIYIAYGRHPQAVDLLNNALAAEPGNPVYRLKLLEIYAELDNEAAAMAQLKKIVDIGDPDSISRAESLIQSLGGEKIGGEAPVLPTAVLDTPVDNGPGLAPNPLDILKDSDETLEEVFSGLEIEEQGDLAEEDDLDLSSDFEVENTDALEGEELVIAADSNALSTKLDLARAYLDMGDDDGARQILDEVVAEGTEDLKAEARALLDRIG